ncbi:hypothetical protein [Fusobacterium mortiferum]|uniref:hypothetical protein n=1 Tax=Fusobacterium mortiferum TaxID=850 RepID=UPI003F93DD92
MTEIEKEYKEARKELINFYFKIIVGLGAILGLSSQEIREKFELLYIIGIPIFIITFSIHREYLYEYRETKKEYLESLSEEKRRKFTKISVIDMCGEAALLIIYGIFFAVILVKNILEILVIYFRN